MLLLVRPITRDTDSAAAHGLAEGAPQLGGDKPPESEEHQEDQQRSTQRSSILGLGVQLALTGCAILVVLCQLFFQIRVQLANEIDARKAVFYEIHLRGAGGARLPSEWDSEGDPDRPTKEGDWGRSIDEAIELWNQIPGRGWWSTVFHVGLTMVLCAIAGLVAPVHAAIVLLVFLLGVGVLLFAWYYLSHKLAKRP